MFVKILRGSTQNVHTQMPQPSWSVKTHGVTAYKKRLNRRCQMLARFRNSLFQMLTHLLEQIGIVVLSSDIVALAALDDYLFCHYVTPEYDFE